MADILTLIISKIGAPLNTVTYTAIKLWAESEGMASSDNNPLATTYACCGGVSINSDGVKRYPTVANGAEATAITLLLKPYAEVVSAFQAGKSMGDIYTAINASPWCARCQNGHYPIALYDALGAGFKPISPPGGGGGGSGNPQSGKHWSDMISAWTFLQHTFGAWTLGQWRHYMRQADKVRRISRS